jgi:ring-1,2-phenylacetyl-CoA epoxidase subunit PaaE
VLFKGAFGKFSLNVNAPNSGALTLGGICRRRYPKTNCMFFCLSIIVAHLRDIKRLVRKTSQTRQQNMDFHALKIGAKTAETPDTVTLTFDLTEEQKALFKYRPGQYLTFKLQVNGAELRRAYSMSSAPIDDKLSVTVKKVSGGRASTYLHDQIQVGDNLETALPDGRFVAVPNADKKRTWYFFAAGSGITPIMSIIKTLLEEEPMSTLYLLYGNRTDGDIIFKEQLDRLAQRYENQLFVDYILSRPVKSEGGIFGMFKRSNWQGLKGRIDDDTVMEWLDDRLPQGLESDCMYYACGPGNMAEVVEDALISKGVTHKQIYKELFLNAGDAPGADVDTTDGIPMEVTIKGQTHLIKVPAKNTILDVLIAQKIDAPYSCTSGACSTCMARVKKGKVRMDACYALDDDEVANGYVLTCQAHPETTDVVLTFDE